MFVISDNRNPSSKHISVVLESSKMNDLGNFALWAEIVGSRDPLSDSQILECAFHAQWGSYPVVDHDRLWCLIGWASRFPEKKVVDCYMQKPKLSYKQASISFFVNHGPHVLSISILMALFEAMGHACDLSYLKLTILAFSVVTG